MKIRTILKTDNEVDIDNLHTLLNKICINHKKELFEIYRDSFGTKNYLCALELFGYQYGLFRLEFKQLKKSFLVNIKL